MRHKSEDSSTVSFGKSRIERVKKYLSLTLNLKKKTTKNNEISILLYSIIYIVFN